LESKIMAALRGLRECAKLKGVGFVHVGSFGKVVANFGLPAWRPPKRAAHAARRKVVLTWEGNQVEAL